MQPIDSICDNGFPFFVPARVIDTTMRIYEMFGRYYGLNGRIFLDRIMIPIHMAQPEYT